MSMNFRVSLAQFLAMGRTRSMWMPVVAASMAAISTSSMLLTSPGMAASGHCVQQAAHPVHFSPMNSGTSRRTPLMSRTTPVAAGTALMAANGSARPSSPSAQTEHTCSQKRPSCPKPGCACGDSISIGMCGTVPCSTSKSPATGTTALSSSNPRRMTRTLSSTTDAPLEPNLYCNCLAIPLNSASSVWPSAFSSGDALKKAPMNAAPCMR